MRRYSQLFNKSHIDYRLDNLFESHGTNLGMISGNCLINHNSHLLRAGSNLGTVPEK
jgi:hypothetical protein